MKRLVVAITTRIGNKIHYVKTETIAANGEIAVELTTKEAEIKEYESSSLADSQLPKIRNPFGRQYRVEMVSVWHRKPNVHLQTDMR